MDMSVRESNREGAYNKLHTVSIELWTRGSLTARAYRASTASVLVHFPRVFVRLPATHLSRGTFSGQHPAGTP